MNENLLMALIADSDNAYELVMKLKRLKEAGYTHVKCTRSRVHIGKLMYEIVDMNKRGYKFSEILAELKRY